MQSKPEPFEQKAAQVEVDDAVSIASRDKGSHGDNVFGVIVLNSPQVAETLRDGIEIVGSFYDIHG